MAFVLTGRDLAHFHLLRPLGSGAMSEVYLARETQLGREVAVKVILDSVARKPGLVQRFEREARAAERLDHPNVARVFYFGQTPEGAPFYAMELVDGWSLADVVEARVRMRVDQMLALLAQTCAGLQAAQDAGIVHRDIKPANLMIGTDGVLKVVDFGLAKLSDDKPHPRSGTMLGTPYYMAPEVVRGEGGDWRADIYSLGVTFFHALVGYPPYEADTPYGVMMKHINQPVPDIAKANPRLPAGLANLITSMLAKSPEDRPQSYKLLQANVMRLAAELTPRELMIRLAWCAHESRNTVDQGGKCSSCQKPYGGAERHARFHVDIVGWHRNGAEEEVASYIGRAVGNPPEVIAPLLKELPFRAAFRSPRERARRMQRTFFEMGADVELSPAEEKAGGLGDSDIKELPFRPHWPPEVQGEDGTQTGSIDTQSLLARTSDSGERLSPGKLAIAALSGLVVVLGAALFLERNGGEEATPTASEPVSAEETADAGRANPEPANPATETPTAEPDDWDRSRGNEQPNEDIPAPAADADVEVPSGEPEETSAPPVQPLRSRRFDVVLADAVEPGLAQGALSVLERQAEEIDDLLGLRPETVDLRFTEAPHVDEGGGRAWPAAITSPLEFPMGGVTSANAASFTPAARLLYGRNALHRAAGGDCPPWLLVGLSLVLEQNPQPPTAVADLIESGDITPLTIDVAMGTNPPRTERLLHSYASWLVTEQGWDRVQTMLAALARSGSAEAAFIQAFAQSPQEIEAEWAAAVTAVE